MRTQNTWLRLLTSEFPPPPMQMKRSSQEHWDLIAAINAFDADRAAEIMRIHSERSQVTLMGRMQRKRSDKQANGG
jgi:DNA-binding GntR family transcriptional regulator